MVNTSDQESNTDKKPQRRRNFFVRTMRNTIELLLDNMKEQQVERVTISAVAETFNLKQLQVSKDVIKTNIWHPIILREEEKLQGKSYSIVDLVNTPYNPLTQQPFEGVVVTSRIHLSEKIKRGILQRLKKEGLQITIDTNYISSPWYYPRHPQGEQINKKTTLDYVSAQLCKAFVFPVSLKRAYQRHLKEILYHNTVLLTDQEKRYTLKGTS
jgi:hypothetical protein